MRRRAVQVGVAVVNSYYVSVFGSQTGQQARKANKQTSYGCRSQRNAENNSEKYTMMTDIIADTPEKFLLSAVHSDRTT